MHCVRCNGIINPEATPLVYCCPNTHWQCRVCRRVSPGGCVVCGGVLYFAELSYKAPKEVALLSRMPSPSSSSLSSITPSMMRIDEDALLTFSSVSMDNVLLDDLEMRANITLNPQEALLKDEGKCNKNVRVEVLGKNISEAVKECVEKVESCSLQQSCCMSKNELVTRTVGVSTGSQPRLVDSTNNSGDLEPSLQPALQNSRIASAVEQVEPVLHALPSLGKSKTKEFDFDSRFQKLLGTLLEGSGKTQSHEHQAEAESGNTYMSTPHRECTDSNMNKAMRTERLNAAKSVDAPATPQIDSLDKAMVFSEGQRSSSPSERHTSQECRYSTNRMISGTPQPLIERVNAELNKTADLSQHPSESNKAKSPVLQKPGVQHNEDDTDEAPSCSNSLQRSEEHTAFNRLYDRVSVARCLYVKESDNAIYKEMLVGVYESNNSHQALEQNPNSHAPIACPETLCRKSLFTSDLVRHVLREHQGVLAERIVPGQPKNFVIDPQLSVYDVNKVNIMYVLRDNVESTDDSNYNEFPPLLVMSTLVSTAELCGLRRDAQKGYLLMIWLAGTDYSLVNTSFSVSRPGGWSLTIAAKPYPIRSSQNVKNILQDGDIMLLTQAQIQELTDHGQNMLELQLIVH